MTSHLSTSNPYSNTTPQETPRGAKSTILPGMEHRLAVLAAGHIKCAKSASARASEREGSAVRLRRRSSSPEREVGGGGNERRSLAPLDSFVRSSPSPCSLAYSSAAAKSGDPGKSDRYLKGSKVVGRRSDQGSACPGAARRG